MISTKSSNSKSVNSKFKKTKDLNPQPIKEFNFSDQYIKNKTSQMLTMKTHPAMSQPDSFVNLKNKNVSRDFIKSKVKKTNDENEILKNERLMNESLVSCQFSNELSRQGSRRMSGMSRPASGLNRPTSGMSIYPSSGNNRPTSRMSRPTSVKSVLRPINISPNRPTSAGNSVTFNFDVDTSKTQE